MSILSEWLKEMVGKKVEVEMEDSDFEGKLVEVTDDPMLSIKLSEVIGGEDEEELGTTVISWCSGYRISELH